MQKHNSILKIAISDDHAMVREAISCFINTWEDCKVILQASNGSEFLENLTPSYLPDIAIIDINMPIMNGYNTIKALTEKYPSVKAIAYSMFSSEESLLLLLLVGARSFLHKGDDLYSIKKAVQEVSTCLLYTSDAADE